MNKEKVLAAAQQPIIKAVASMQIPDAIRPVVEKIILTDPNTQGHCLGYGWQSLQKMNARDAKIFIENNNPEKVSFRSAYGPDYITVGGNQYSGQSKVYFDGRVESPFI